MRNIFTEHPHQIGESYFEHFKNAFIFGINMLLGGFACIIHAILPFLFVKTASNYLFKMTQRFVSRMSTVEDRMICLSETLDKKMRECGYTIESR